MLLHIFEDIWDVTINNDAKEKHIKMLQAAHVPSYSSRARSVFEL